MVNERTEERESTLLRNLYGDENCDENDGENVHKCYRKRLVHQNVQTELLS